VDIDKMLAVEAALKQSNTVNFQRLGLASDEIFSIIELVK
jgi:hypothetical protein